MSTLRGKTLFITGASRGVGLAIALRAARDGANVAVVAKTSAPHPKLPGTVHSAVDEIQAAGGHGLACVCDIRFEEQVEDAVAQTLQRFGRIDILVNNASAIHLAGTLETSMKRYDLMNQINGRGTYLCSQKCLPHLAKAANPHILNISPPLNFEARWFAGHVAYSIAKYNMSLCTLGMSAEFADRGIAVNSLWPRTVIWTAAVENLIGANLRDMARKPTIMGDAAHAILVRDARQCTGNYFVDDDVLRDAGVDDLDQYAVSPGHDLQPDFFL